MKEKNNQEESVEPIPEKKPEITGKLNKLKLRFLSSLRQFYNAIVERLFMKPFHFFRTLFLITGILSWVVIFTFVIIIYGFFHSMPDFEEMTFEYFQMKAKIQVYEKLQNKDSAYFWTPIEEINRDLLYAIVMAEDGTYFEHHGINYDALFYSLGEDIKQRRFAIGGSTISQQVVKNVFLTNAKTFTRKLKEIIITHRMEKKFTKNQILEIYLNVAEFGPDIYGVGRASKYYFEKIPININAAEGAFLAIMLPSPRKYHYSIFQNRYLGNRHIKKINRILKDMLYKEFISPIQYREYLQYSYF